MIKKWWALPVYPKLSLILFFLIGSFTGVKQNTESQKNQKKIK